MTELRHVQGLYGSLSLNGTAYMSMTIFNDHYPKKQIIYSDFKGVIIQGQSIFDNMWKNSIPAQLRIAEIENANINSMEKSSVEYIKDPEKIVEIIKESCINAEMEILILFLQIIHFVVLLNLECLIL